MVWVGLGVGFGFSGRVNFLSNTPEDIANTFNCVYYLLEKFQREQGRNEDTSSEVKRLRNELQVGENVCGRLKKDLEMRERDIGTMMIKARCCCLCRAAAVESCSQQILFGLG